MIKAKEMMETTDLKKILLDKLNHAKIKNGILTINKTKEMFNLNRVLSKIAIPVAPPSKKPLGNKNNFKPRLARKIPIVICTNSDKFRFIE